MMQSCTFECAARLLCSAGPPCICIFKITRGDTPMNESNRSLMFLVCEKRPKGLLERTKSFLIPFCCCLQLVSLGRGEKNGQKDACIGGEAHLCFNSRDIF